MRSIPRTFLWLLGLMLVSGPWSAVNAQDTSAADDGTETPSSFVDSLTAGTTRLALRYRFEFVDQDGIDDGAEASTLQTRLSYHTAPYKGFRFFVQAQNVTALPDDDNYNNAGANSLNNGVRDRPVVADPEETTIQQVYLTWTFDATALKIGRQEINLGNQRFVGSVGWRQNPQSFNALTVTNGTFPGSKISYHYLDKVNRIFGDRRDMSSHLLHGAFDLGERNKLTAYGYWLDYDRSEGSLVLSSTSTYGLRWAGHVPFDEVKLSYALEAAQQQDIGDNPRNVDADYLLAELAAGTPRITGKVGYESLSGSVADGAFSTPLATLHKFNGWADKFLRTPTLGLVDVYASISGSVDRFKWSAVYHDFQSESGSRDYGTEWDALATYKIDAGVTFGLKAALYEADGFATDTDKIMFWTAYSFGR